MTRFTTRSLPTAALAGLIVAVAACRSAGGQPSAPPGTAMTTLTVTSKSFPSGGTVPVDFTCDGADRSPHLTWSAPPAGTKTFAVVVDDPDAPGGTFTHWVVYDVPAETLAIAEGADPASFGGVAGTNDFKRVVYSGPCPPKMELHHYEFRVYALDTKLGLVPGATRAALDTALGGHTLAEGTLVGTFSH